MTYQLDIKDAELRSKLSQPLTESLKRTASPINVTQQITQATGIPVVTRFDERTNTMQVKRILTD